MLSITLQYLHIVFKSHCKIIELNVKIKFAGIQQLRTQLIYHKVCFIISLGIHYPVVIYCLVQRFAKCGPRTPRGPRKVVLVNFYALE